MSDLFRPADGGKATVRMEVSSASSRTLIPVPSRHASIRIVVAGDNTVFVAFGDDTVEATEDDMPMLPGSVEAFQASSEELYIAAVVPLTSPPLEGSVLYITCGEGE